MSAITYSPTCCSGPDAGWVLAAPFRSWLAHLSSATGFDPLTISVAAGVPTRVARSLARGNVRPRRIRAVDAMNLMSIDVGLIKRMGCMLADASPARQALAELGPSWRPDVDSLMKRTGIGADIATGLLDGWLDVCQKWVVWRCIALAQDITYQRTMDACRESGTTIWQPDDLEDDMLDDFDDQTSTALAA